jgi:four helix bundle protein
VNFSEWELSVPDLIRNDVLWEMKVYRLALFLSDMCWEDVTKLSNDGRTKALSDQLYRAAGSITANLEEGYSKNSGKDRARFYEYALGSARETRGWSYRGRHILGGVVFEHRGQLITQIIKLLLTIVPAERCMTVCESAPEYLADSECSDDIPF